ncbi:hypothetical protein HYT26_02490 [Candidatus Pacearchaeota archaeon]|nr:hypothetical protein [Candidatus Pacearchaeota archaeon]
MRKEIEFMVYEGLMTFSFVAAGINFADGRVSSLLIALAYFTIAFFSYSQVILLIRELNVVPFYFRWLK